MKKLKNENLNSMDSKDSVNNYLCDIKDVHISFEIPLINMAIKLVN